MCILDTSRHVLMRNGSDVSVEPQVFALLAFLAANGGRLVTKDEVVEAVWHGRAVSDATINSRISAARAAVGDNGKDQSIIRTHNRLGFELVGPVDSTEEASGRGAPAIQQTIKYATSTDGIKIAFAESGSGPNVLRAGHFLTHLELDWQSPIWRPYLDAISTQHRLVRYDQRGTGLSDERLGEIGVEAYAEDLKAVADASGLETFSLIATSQGVPAAIKLAAENPDRVKNMVLYGGFAKGRARRENSYSQDEAQAMLTMIKSGWGDPKSAFMTAFTSLFCPDASKEEIDNLVEIQLASASPENAACIRRAIDLIDVSDLLSQIQTPTLVIHANNDSVHPFSQGRFLASHIPNAQFVRLDSRNHVPLPSDPVYEQFLSATLDFIDR